MLYQPLGFPRDHFRPLSRGQPHSSNLNHFFDFSFESLITRLSAMTHKIGHFIHKIQLLITRVCDLQFFIIDKLFSKANVHLFLRVCQLNRAFINSKIIHIDFGINHVLHWQSTNCLQYFSIIVEKRNECETFYVVMG